MTLRFVGNYTEFADQKFTQLGQKLEGTEETLKHLVAGGAAFIREEEFNAIFTSKEELAKFKSAGSRHAAPDSFKEKATAALAKVGSPPVAPPATPAKDQK
jgi:hypothetical protein